MWFKNVQWLVIIAATTVTTMPIDDFDIDIDKTVENVQNILEAHPELPRLTNDDIMMLLKNITDEDRRKIGIPKEKNKIMIVLPFTSTSTKAEDMSDLFTKRPITKYVSSHSYSETEETTQSVNVMKQSEENVKKSHKNNNKKINKERESVKKETTSTSTTKSPPIFINNQEQLLDLLQIPPSEVSAYETFKPLPLAYKQNIDIPIDIKNVLKTYDLLQNSNKTISDEPELVAAQSIQNETFAYVDPDIFPPEMANVLKEIGLTKPDASRAYLPIPPTPETTTVQELAEGINPVLSEDEDVVDDQTNDIQKRQQSNDTTAATTITTERLTTTEKTTTVSEGANMKDLEDSFGGSKADNDPSQAELPPPRKNGFYYMLDWNSFLEVGDGDTKVDIRFDPKLGDPQRFLPYDVDNSK